MNQENFGKFIKEIRKKNNLTQKQLADKYNVTYQAVSKWENGKNMPDTLLIKQMSEDFNISLEEMFEGKLKRKNNNKKKIILFSLLIVLIIFSITLLVYINNKNSDFNFNALSSNCNNFNIVGTIAYNDTKSSIYITNIEYCGKTDNRLYNKIECTLYEKNDDISKIISHSIYDDTTKITLNDYLKTVTFSVYDYKKICKEYKENSLYLEVNIEDDDYTATYKIPLTIIKPC